MRALILALLLAGGSVRADSISDEFKIVFRDGVSSSGWIGFKPYKASGIFFPARVNGRNVMVFLYGGPTSLDRNLARSVKLLPKSAATDEARFVGVMVQVGDLTLSNMEAAPVDAPTQLANITGRPVPLLLGEEAFNRLVVDIDYSHHRLAFRDPTRVARPTRAVEVPLIKLDGERSFHQRRTAGSIRAGNRQC